MTEKDDMSPFYAENIVSAESVDQDVNETYNESKKLHLFENLSNQLQHLVKVGPNDQVDLSEEELESLRRGFDHTGEQLTEVVELLEDIKNNTESLHEIVTLLHQNVKLQEDIKLLLNDYFDLLNSKDKEEAETRFAVLTKKINEMGTTAENIKILSGIIKTAFITLQTNL